MLLSDLFQFSKISWRKFVVVFAHEESKARVNKIVNLTNFMILVDFDNHVITFN